MSSSPRRRSHRDVLPALCVALVVALFLDCPSRAQTTDERILWSQECYGGIQAPVIGLDGTLYASDGGGVLWVLAADGTKLARSVVAKGHYLGELVISDQGIVYATSDTLLSYKPAEKTQWITYLHAFDPAGTALWRLRLVPEGRTGSKGAIALDSKGDLVVAVQGDSLLCFVTRTGVLKRQLRLTSRIRDLAVGPDGTVYACGEDGVDAITPDGRIDWRWPSERPLGGQMAIDGSGNVFVCSTYHPSSRGPGVLYSIDRQGKLRGQVGLEEGTSLFVSPVLDGEGNLVFLEPPFFYGTAVSSVLHSVTSGGEPYWRLPLSAYGSGSLAVGADETIYVLGDDNQHTVLYALDSLGGRERWQIRFGNGGFPRFTLSDSGVLYLPMGNYLYAIQTDSPGLADSPWPMPRHDPRNTGRVSGPATAVLETAREGLPTGCRLGPSYPNPFNAGTVIPFELPVASPAEVRVYDVLGQEVALLAKGWFAAGRHQVRWEPQGQGSAVYLCRLTTPAGSSMRRLVLVK